MGEPRLGLAEQTVLVLGQNDCLVISFDEEDIGKTQASKARDDSYFALALADGIETGTDAQGPFIRASIGTIARPGDVIDGIILRMEPKSDISFFEAVVRYGWPLDNDCGVRMAEIHAINNVRRPPVP